MARKISKHPALAIGYGKRERMKRAALSIAALDSNPEIRAALIARIVKIAATAPVIMLHQVAQVLELASTE